MAPDLARRVYEQLTELARRARAAAQLAAAEEKQLRLDVLVRAAEESVAAFVEAHPDVPREEKPRCSFCNKSQGDARKLIEGSGAYICDECVLLSADILGEEPDDDRDTTPTDPDDEPAPDSSVHPSTAPRPMTDE